jgi:hypothetical protein
MIQDRQEIAMAKAMKAAVFVEPGRIAQDPPLQAR